jgi:hypothetical protein
MKINHIFFSSLNIKMLILIIITITLLSITQSIIDYKTLNK